MQIIRDCSICMQNIDSTSCDYTATQCGHEFHSKCLLTYLINYRKSNCPCCRGNLCEPAPLPSIVDVQAPAPTLATSAEEIQPSTDEETLVTVFVLNRRTYLIDVESNVYDFNSHNEIGRFCRTTNQIIRT
jgi:hypothetical protein